LSSGVALPNPKGYIQDIFGRKTGLPNARKRSSEAFFISSISRGCRWKAYSILFLPKKFMFCFIHFDPSLKEVARAEALQEVFP
jgi:hypothetical protein